MQRAWCSGSILHTRRKTKLYFTEDKTVCFKVTVLESTLYVLGTKDVFMVLLKYHYWHSRINKSEH